MPRLLAQVRTAIRLRRYSVRTERAYVAWVRRFVRYCGGRHPSLCGEADVRGFLTQLTTERRVSASTQNQALCALVFLYRHVLSAPLGSGVVGARAQRVPGVPSVLAPEEIEQVFAQLTGDVRLLVMLLYGAGLRLGEAVALRVKDVDLARGLISVRNGKGVEDRRTVLPSVLHEPLADHVNRVRARHLADVQQGGGLVPLPGAAGHEMPGAARDFRWTWVFPASRHFTERRTGRRMLYHVHATTVHRAISRAGLRAGLTQRVSARTFRHSFATHLLRDGYDIRTVQTLLGHGDVATTMRYLHVLETGASVRSPLDTLRLTRAPTVAVGRAVGAIRDVQARRESE